jgi:hypothetical protein
MNFFFLQKSLGIITLACARFWSSHPLFPRLPIGMFAAQSYSDLGSTPIDRRHAHAQSYRHRRSRSTWLLCLLLCLLLFLLKSNDLIPK